MKLYADGGWTDPFPTDFNKKISSVNPDADTKCILYTYVTSSLDIVFARADTFNLCTALVRLR